jgi:hypothetical protein
MTALNARNRPPKSGWCKWPATRLTKHPGVFVAERKEDVLMLRLAAFVLLTSAWSSGVPSDAANSSGALCHTRKQSDGEHAGGNQRANSIPDPV